MRTLPFLLLLAACGGGDDATDTDGSMSGFDEADFLEVTDRLKGRAQAEVVGNETVVDDQGCTRPRYEITCLFCGVGIEGFMGMALCADRLQVLEHLDPEDPNEFYYDLDASGHTTPVGLNWIYTFETFDDIPDEHPQMFGVDMMGPMDPHAIPGFPHYDMHAFPWRPDDGLDHGYFGNENPSMARPGWVDQAEPVFYTVQALRDPDLRASLGYVAGDCTDGQGVAWVNPAAEGKLDTFDPDTVLTDVHGNLRAVRWTAPSGTAPADMFGQPFVQAPDGTWRLTFWITKLNAEGLFADADPALTCDEAPRAECGPQF